jgi:radical SAM protein with 4Fe4S-binding SPASM domain
MKDPFHIQWHITNLCNLRCKHCYQDDFSKTDDLDWEGLQQISNNILGTLNQWNQAATIHLTGGEPLLKQELFSLLEDLEHSPVVEELGIITNGLLLNENVIQRLSKSSKLRKIKISLDGADEETNDSIRQEDTFKRVIQNISSIKEKGSFEIILMLTVMRRNFRGLSDFFNLSRELGTDGFIIERFIPLGRGRERMDEVLSKKEWGELTETLLNLFSIDEKNALLPFQAFQVNFTGEEPELLGAPCVIGKDGLCIMPEGSVFPCRRFPVPVGNLMNKSLKEIWEKSSLLGQLRKKKNLEGRCGKCGIEDCRGCRSLALALTGDYLAEDPHCWYSFNA